MKVAIINSFIYENTGGNPAGVVIDLDCCLSEETMVDIAKKVGLSETAFINKGTEGADFDLRFFTPTDEVPLCGHASIASFWLLAKKGMILKDVCMQKTKAGLLKLKIDTSDVDNIKVTMEQAQPLLIRKNLVFDEQFKHAFMDAEISFTLPIDIWSTGLEDVLLPIESLENLNRMSVNFDVLSDLSKSLNVIGVHAFSIASGCVHARNFAPLYGINEEAATGTSNGALTAYLHHYLHPLDNRLDLAILQGESMGETSAIFTVSVKSDNHHHIWVGGYCKYIKDLEI